MATNAGTTSSSQHRQQQPPQHLYGHSNGGGSQQQLPPPPLPQQQQQEDFVFWSPPSNSQPAARSKIPSPHHPNHNFQRTNSNILVEHQQQQNGGGLSSRPGGADHPRRYAMNHAPRPKMGVTSRKVGVPVMTSTPSIVSSNPDPDNEPIYCEITKGDSPLKSSVSSTSSPSSKKSFPVQRRPIKQRTNLNRNRLAGDFSQLKLNRGDASVDDSSATQSNVESKLLSSSAKNSNHRLSCDFSNYAAIPTLTSTSSNHHHQQQHHNQPYHHQQPPRPAGLGRRAVTQLEIITSSRSAGLSQAGFGSGMPSNQFQQHMPQVRSSTRDLTTTTTNAGGPYCSDSEYSQHKRPHAYLQRNRVPQVRSRGKKERKAI